MKLHDNTTLILGPPGTGKTTRLLEFIEQSIKDGVSPSSIGFVAFTRKAATEARERAMKKFKLKSEKLPWFRTLHSLAYNTLGLMREELFGPQECAELGRILGVTIRMSFTSWDDNVVAGEMGGVGSAMMFLDNLARVRCEQLKTTYHTFGDHTVSWSRLEHFSRTFAAYKQKNNLVDYTDMLHNFIEDEDAFTPPLKMVIVDEAQDLTQLQWRMVQRLCSHSAVDKVVIAGDDDQAIYEWSGADVDTFLLLEGYVKETVVLNVSHRLPSSIWKFANTISGRIKNRYEKKWTPRTGSKGSVTYVHTVEDLPLEEGEWLILTRNRCFLEAITNYCYSQGLAFSCVVKGLSPLGDGSETGGKFEVIKWWEDLRKGRKITGLQARRIYEYLPVGKDKGVARGHKLIPNIDDFDEVDLDHLIQHCGLSTRAIWHKAFTRIPASEREYFISLLRNGEKPTTPRIHVSTVHSVKGGEADNVALLHEMTGKTYNGYLTQPEPEHRVWYVGATRARKNLFILDPLSQVHYHEFS